MAYETIEEVVEDYEDLVDSLIDKVKVDIKDYVRDIAIAAWNSALAGAEFEVVTCIENDTPEEMQEALKKDLQALRL